MHSGWKPQIDSSIATRNSEEACQKEEMGANLRSTPIRNCHKGGAASRRVDSDSMALNSEINQAVEEARRLLKSHGYECATTTEDLVCWFEADTPFEGDPGLDEILTNPLIVAHELVEIENVKRMGLSLTKDVILENLEKVDDAHLKATEIELELAASTKALRHIRNRLKNIEMWSEDATVTPENKEKYRRMYSKTLRALERLV
ncbi:MAG: hypothetical protein OEM29_05480 [Thermoplasmata archaeon]|nr:hypothetical protein [Thermoplasmata archaeon]